MAVISRVLRTIRDEALLRPGDRLLVAVSGGADSTALLVALSKEARRLEITLGAATVDHGLRPESAAEAVTVQNRCADLGIGCEVLRVHVGRAAGSHISLQDAARRVRLGALEEAARRGGFSRVALAHTADDQAETILFRIVRGTGVKGLAGIPYARDLFIRPLLDVRRAEVIRFLEKRRIPFIQDPSNLDRRFSRVRIRLDWIPFLRKENPRLVDALLGLAREARAGTSPSELPLDEALWVNRRAGATVARLKKEGQGTTFVSVAGATIQVSYGRATRLPDGPRGPAGKVRTETTQVRVPGVYRLAGLADGPKLEIVRREGNVVPEAGVVAFDGSAVAEPLLLRAPQAGDRMRPRGGRGSRKLSDLLIDAKIPRTSRSHLPVLTAADGTILFVPGLRPAECGRPTEKTRSWIQVRAL